MTRRTEDALPSLLALTQCAALIHHVASTGTVDHAAMERVLDCLYGRALPGDEARGSGGYAIGRAVLDDLLRGELPENQRNIRTYIRVLARLERRLARRPALLARLLERLTQARDRQAGFALPATNAHAVLGGIYVETLGTLRPALSVIGP